MYVIEYRDLSEHERVLFETDLPEVADTIKRAVAQLDHLVLVTINY